MPLSIDHTSIVVPVSKLDDMVKFLLAALKPLGLREWMRPTPTSVGLGDKTPFFWVTGVEGDEETLRSVMRCEHFAFSAGSELFFCFLLLLLFSVAMLSTRADGLEKTQPTSLWTLFIELRSQPEARTMARRVRGRSIIRVIMRLMSGIRFVGLILKSSIIMRRRMLEEGEGRECLGSGIFQHVLQACGI
jgi:hypothetical protein